MDGVTTAVKFITTTPSIEGKLIKEYRGIVLGEAINGINMFRDFAAEVRNVVGGRSKSYEKSLSQAKVTAITEMCERAKEVGANAVVGFSINCTSLGEGGHGMLLVSAIGTAVVIEDEHPEEFKPKITKKPEESKGAKPESVTIDRTKEYICCPYCEAFQKSNRSVCQRCGVKFD